LTLEDLTVSNLLAFLQHLQQERGNCTRTVNCRLAALRCFFHYAGARLGPDAIAQVQRVRSIPFKRFTRPLLGYLSEHEIRAILQVSGDSWTGRRDHLLFRFLYNTGARVSEATSVRVEDVQTHDYRAVQLHGKGRKQRVVPLWKETTHHIRAWLKNTALKPEQPLFPNRFGSAMTRTAVQQRLRLCVKSAEPTCRSLARQRISPHTIRHTTAMHLLQSGVAAPVIALWLGHEDIATTHQYIEADLAMKEAALKHISSPKKKYRRYKPTPSLIKFLNSL
jgi:site-specific recombinase XerD